MFAQESLTVLHAERKERKLEKYEKLTTCSFVAVQLQTGRRRASWRVVLDSA